MHVSFSLARWLVITGDLFDEGLWADREEFQATVGRFNSMFQVPSETQLHVVVGNHDIGFHYYR